jgi:uncharacterized membrane protein
MKVFTWISLVAFVLLVTLLPLLFGRLMAVSLAKLHLGPATALLIVIGIFLGGFVNIPVRRITHDEEVTAHPLTFLGLSHLWPELRTIRRETIIAVNVGGCLIPAGLAIYELAHLVALGSQVLFATAVSCIVNTFACYLLARPVPGVGILTPGLIPPIIAATLALILAPEQAPPVAFVAGVAGPLVGADLLHLRHVQMQSRTAGMVSIGGAGTFDGIVLSGIVAAYLA